MAALQYVDVPGYAALLLRRSYADLALPGALMPRADEWLRGTKAHWNDTEKTWSFPSGATVTFGYLQTEVDKYRYQGAAFQMIGFDELTQFTESTYTYLFSRLRRLQGVDIPLRMRGASNPGGLGHEWVKERFIARGNSLSRLFIPAKLQDNPYLDADAYRKSLFELDPVTRAQLLAGDWDVQPAGGFFQAHWFKYVDAVPVTARRVRFWDLAATTDGDFTVGLKMSEADGIYYIEDVKRGQWTPHDRDAVLLQTAEDDGLGVIQYIEEEGGAAGKAQSASLIRLLSKFTVRFERPTGDKAVRAGPVASQAQAGNVKVLRALWNRALLDELALFPVGAHDDQVDGLSGAYNRLHRPAPAPPPPSVSFGNVMYNRR